MQHETYERTLKNGNRLAVIHVPGAPVYQFETIVQSGFQHAPKGLYELPHLLEHLAFEGSDNYPDAQKFRYELERYGIYHNAWTNFYRNGYVLYGAIEYWEHITQLALEQLLHPLFRDEEIAQQKQVVENELVGKRNNPDHRVFHLLYRLQKNMLAQDYDERLKGLHRITRQDVLDYYAKLYHPANMLHVVVGDMSEDRAEKIMGLIDAAMAGTKQRRALEDEIVQPTVSRPNVYVQEYPYEESAVFGLSFFQPGFYDAETLPLGLLRTIFGVGMYSRIFQKARRQGLTYSLNSGVSSDKEMLDLFFDDKTQVRHLVPLLELIFAELASITQGDFSDEELDRAVGFLSGHHAVRFQTATSFVSWYSPHYVQGLPKRDPEAFHAELQAVTREQIMAAGQLVLARDNPHRLLAVAGQGVKAAELQQLLDGFGVQT